MSKSSYYQLMQEDSEAYDSCAFQWACDTCDRTLCLRIVGVADFPSIYGHFTILAFTNNKDNQDHVMIVKGNVINQEQVLTRLHSSCLTGDVLGSLRCDCADQLHQALVIINREELGAVLYMQQEGRGIGLHNKIKAYMLQERGLDTYDANVLLGFNPDERQYEISAAMLAKLQVKSVRLLTNNPDKIQGLQHYGVTITERVPLEIPANAHNRFYLLTKQKRFGHLLHLNSQ